MCLTKTSLISKKIIKDTKFKIKPITKFFNKSISAAFLISKKKKKKKKNKDNIGYFTFITCFAIKDRSNMGHSYIFALFLALGENSKLPNMYAFYLVLAYSYKVLNYFLR